MDKTPKHQHPSSRSYAVPDINHSLMSIHNMFSMVSHENDHLHYDIMDIYDAIDRRIAIIFDDPLESDLQVKELRVIIKYLEENFEKNELILDKEKLKLEGAYCNQFLRHLEILRKSLSSFVKDSFHNSNKNSPPDLPSERPAPIRVAVENGKLVLSQTHEHIGSVDYDAANRIRESLRETFAELLSQMHETSNVDSRYIKSCEKLLTYLSQPLENVSIEAFGLNYQLVEKMTRRISDETSGIIIDQVEHTLTGVSVLLNQFQEWKDYLEALALSQALGGEASQMVGYAAELADEFGKEGAPVDSQIASRLREMIEPVISGLVSADTISVPLSGSLSNIFSQLSQVVFEQMAFAENHITPTAGAAGSIILANFAVKMLTKFCPILAQFQPLKFIVEVHAYIQKYYSLLKDAFKLGSNG